MAYTRFWNVVTYYCENFPWSEDVAVHENYPLSYISAYYVAREALADAINVSAKGYVDTQTSAVRNAIAQNLGYEDYDAMVEAAEDGETIIVGGFLRTTLIDVQNLVAEKLATSGDTSLLIADNQIKLFDSNGNLRTWLHGNDLTDRTTQTTESVSYNAGNNSSQRTGLSVTRSSGTFAINSTSDSVRLSGSKQFNFGFYGKCNNSISPQTLTIACSLEIRIKNLASGVKTTLYSGSTTITLSASPGQSCSGSASLTASQATALSNIAAGPYVLEVYLGMSPNSSALYYAMETMSYSANQTNGSGSLSVVHPNTSIPQMTEVGKNGIQIFKDATHYLRLGGCNYSQGQNLGGFEFRAGNYGLLLHPSIGFMKYNSATDTWVTITL